MTRSSNLTMASNTLLHGQPRTGSVRTISRFWSDQSPDLNPKDNMWRELKVCVAKWLHQSITEWEKICRKNGPQYLLVWSIGEVWSLSLPTNVTNVKYWGEFLLLVNTISDIMQINCLENHRIWFSGSFFFIIYFHILSLTVSQSVSIIQITDHIPLSIWENGLFL